MGKRRIGLPSKQKAVYYKFTLPKLVLLTVTVLLLAWIVPIDELNILRALNFESLVIGGWLIVIGFAIFFEGILSFPDMQKHASKIGGWILILVGFSSFGFGLIAVFGGIDILYGSPELRMWTTVLFIFGTAVFTVTVFPEIIHRKTTIAVLNG